MSVNSCMGGVNDALKPGISEFVFPPKIFGTTKKAIGEVQVIVKRTIEKTNEPEQLEQRELAERSL